MRPTEPLRLIGVTASPYTQKMLALLRYRRLPYAVIWGHPAEVCAAAGVTPPRPALMPTFLFEANGVTEAVCDSTPIIRRLEGRFEDRSVVPEDPALAFLDALIEDFADEWCTKYMFHFRWWPEEDVDHAQRVLPLALDVSMPAERAEQLGRLFAERQVGRLGVVGSNPETAPVIEESYQRLLLAMERHLAAQPFMLGRRPGAGDFGLFGQLSQLVGFDPTPRAIARQLSPRTVAWVDQLGDLSGLEPRAEDWIPLEAQPDSLQELLLEIGQVYTPAQLANARAALSGEEAWTQHIDGATWSQRTFPYQAKCLRWILEAYHALEDRDRARVDARVRGTGIEALLAFTG